MNTEPRPTSDISPLQDIKKDPSFDFSIVAGVFFVGISIGALIPVGMKFFGYWKAPGSVSQKSVPAEVSKVESEAKSVVSAEPLAPEVTVKAEAVHEKTKAAPAPAKVSLVKDKPVQTRGKIEAAVAERAIAPKSHSELKAQAEIEVAALEKKAAEEKKNQKSKSMASRAPVTGDIIEEVDGPSALEISNLTAAYAAKENQNQNQKMQPTLAMAAPVPAPAEVPAVSAPSETPKAEMPKASAALSINNASYSKNKLEACKKRCLLLGLDAFGMPVKAIINGSSYAQALLQHKGTINLAGQPRLIKNQQVLIVDSITFNLAPSESVSGKSEMPAGINASYKAK